MSEIGKLCVLIFWTFIQIFIFCDTSEYVSSHFRELDMFYLCDWYAFPPVVQRMMPIIIVNTNKRVVISSYGNVLCTRETFQRVRKRIFLHKGEIILYQFLCRFFIHFLGRQWWIFLLYYASSVFAMNYHEMEYQAQRIKH